MRCGLIYSSDNCLQYLALEHLIRNGFPENSTICQVGRYFNMYNVLQRPKKSLGDSGHGFCRLIWTVRRVIQPCFHLLGVFTTTTGATNRS